MKKDKSISDNFCFMFHEFRQYRKGSMLLPLVGSILQIVFSLLSIAFPKMILDLIISGMEYGMMLRRTIVGGGVLILVSVLNSTVRNEIENCSRGCLYLRFVRKWEKKMMELDYERFSSQECKIQAEKARNAVSSPNWGVVEYLARIQELMENTGGFFAYSAIICTLHPLVLLGLLGLFAVEMWYGAVVLRRRQQVKEEIARADRKLHYMAYGLRGMEEGKDIRMYAMTPWLRAIARKAIKGRDEIQQRVSGWERRKGMLRAATAFLRNGFAYIYLLQRYFQGGMSIGDFTLYFAAITGLGGWLERLGEAIRTFAAADQYVTDFKMFMMIKECDQKKKYNISQLDQPVSFTLEKVSFSYENPVLKEIDLEIRPGEKLAVVGVNGAGKTTLVKLLCGLLRPESGRILVNGLDIRGFEREDYYGLFSAVFQNSGILPVSIRDNIALNVRDEVDEEAIWRCVRLAGLERKILSLPEGLDTNLVKQISEHGTSFSGGELQKLLLARALYKDAPVLLLDEPTAALDPVAESRIYQNYNQMAEGKTAIFISHRLASTRFCDRIIVMEEGQIVESGTHSELLEQRGRYAEMYQVQNQYYKDSLEGSER